MSEQEAERDWRTWWASRVQQSKEMQEVGIYSLYLGPEIGNAVILAADAHMADLERRLAEVQTRGGAGLSEPMSEARLVEMEHADVARRDCTCRWCQEMRELLAECRRLRAELRALRNPPNPEDCDVAVGESVGLDRQQLQCEVSR